MLSERFGKCNSCKYYQRHYIDAGYTFHQVEGHCMNNALIATRHKDRQKLEPNCEFWEIDTEEREKRKANLRETVYKINGQLEHILFIFENFK